MSASYSGSDDESDFVTSPTSPVLQYSAAYKRRNPAYLQSPVTMSHDHPGEGESYHNMSATQCRLAIGIFIAYIVACFALYGLGPSVVIALSMMAVGLDIMCTYYYGWKA
ncbi:hypothetical protein F53441_12713 [Fusarium austroafricanum]|uniref:Uncharacterized protein n=1 Tax=Fusarium austroafricanum TaxID=2364996 RepID=A0A8H4JX91_9HYPO|nr:hypothetical protein F53441_12713 [Fusarium austroafricanum]